MPEQRHLRRSYTRVMSILMIVIGMAILVATFAAGGGPAATGVLWECSSSPPASAGSTCSSEADERDLK